MSRLTEGQRQYDGLVSGEDGAEEIPELRRSHWVERSSILAIGFGTTVAMWVIGYAVQLPAAASGGRIVVPVWISFTLLLSCMVAGGFVAGRHTLKALTGRAARPGSFRQSSTSSFSEASSAIVCVGQGIWGIPVWIALSTVIGGVAGLVGARARGAERAGSHNWTQILAVVGTAAAFMLLIVGGLVTTERAGLPVVDWPNTFGHTMFLYTLSRITGGIYFEDAHRLLLHVSLAVVAAFLLLACGARAWGLRDQDPVFRRTGKAVVFATVLQLLLGFGAIIVTGALAGPAQPPSVRVAVTTAHQAVGAFLLARIVVLTLWSYRLLACMRTVGLAEARRVLVTEGATESRVHAVEEHTSDAGLLPLDLARKRMEVAPCLVRAEFNGGSAWGGSFSRPDRQALLMHGQVVGSQTGSLLLLAPAVGGPD